MSRSKSPFPGFKKIQALCSVLNHLHITTFFQLRIFQTGKFLVLSNSLTVYSIFANAKTLGTYFSGLSENSRKDVISVNLWPTSSTDTLLTTLSENHIHYGISISYALDDYIDIFSFAINQDDKNVSNLYINNLLLLKRFIVYFRLKSNKILERKKTKNFAMDQEWKVNQNLSWNSSSHCSKFKDSLLSRYIENTLSKKLNKQIVLSEKERRCLCYLLIGKSIKNLADELSVSRNTVQVYLKNILTKTGFYTKDQLLTIFNQDAFLSELI